MDTSAMMHAMKDSISEVLEQMFFLPIDFVDPGQPSVADDERDEDLMTTSVGFSGAVQGRFRLTMPKSLAIAVTADFMGAEPDQLTDDQVAGAVTEMINMLAGNTLSAYAPQAVFDLQIPQLGAAAAADQCNTPDDRSQIDIGIQTLDSGMTFRLLTEEN